MLYILKSYSINVIYITIKLEGKPTKHVESKEAYEM